MDSDEGGRRTAPPVSPSLNQGALSLASLLVMGIGKLLFTLLTARTYGPEGQGIVALGITFMVSAAVMLGLGTEVANTYLVGARPDLLRSLRRASLAFSAFSAIAALLFVEALFFFFGTSIFRHFPSSGKGLLVPLIVLQIYHLQLQGLVVGLGNFRALTVANLFQYSTVVLGVVALSAAGAPVAGVLVVWGIGLLAKCAWCLRALPRSGEGPTSWTGALSEQVGYGVRAMPGSVANLVNFRLDTYFIAYFLTTSQLGWYSIAATIAEGTLYLPKAFGQIAFAWAARSGGKSDRRAVVRDLFLATFYSSLLLVAAAQLVLAPLIPLVFGEAFVPALPVARVLLAAAFLYGVGLLGANLMYGFGDPTWNTRSGLISASLNAAANLVLIPRFGLMGAAWASFVSYGSFLFLTIGGIRRHLGRELVVASLFLPTRSHWERSRELARRLSRRSEARGRSDRNPDTTTGAEPR